MRLLLTADTVGGVWSYALELARGLSARGVEIALATMGRALSADQRREAEGVPGLVVYESEYKLCWMDGAWDDVRRAGDWLERVVGAFRPDVVHLNDYPFGARDWDVPVLMVGHSCVVSWWRGVWGSDPGPEWDAYRRVVREGLAGANLVVTPTWAMLRALEEAHGRLPHAVVIPNGRDAEAYQPARKEPFVFAAGRVWDDAKNVSLLVRSGAGLDWPVIVAGEDRPPRGAERARPMETAGVRCVGRLSAAEVARYMERAAIYAMPARYEPFGLSILEAALCGCALVLGDIPSLRENWDGAALFVDPHDVRGLERSVNGLARNPAEREQLAARGRGRGLQFSSPTMCARYLGAYEALVRSGTGSRVAVNEGIAG